MPAAAMLALAGSVIASAAGCVMISRRMREVGAELEELKARASAGPAESATAGRAPARMMRALYPERSGVVDALERVPGWQGLAAGVALALAAMVLATGEVHPAPAAPSEPEKEASATRAAVDSIAGEMRRLADSLRVAAAAQPAKTALAERPRPSPRVRSAAPELPPPPPSLQPVAAP